MTQYIELGGQMRPILFGWGGLYEYEQRTGRKALADFAQLSAGLENVSVTVIVDLIYSGLIAGHRADKRNVDFDVHDVATWINGQDTVEQVMKLFADSFPQSEGNGQKGKPKAATPTG